MVTRSAFVMANTEVGKEDEILGLIEEIQGVEEAHKVFGVYDLIVKVRGKDIDELTKIISDKIRAIEGLQATLTMLILLNPK